MGEDPEGKGKCFLAVKAPVAVQTGSRWHCFVGSLITVIWRGMTADVPNLNHSNRIGSLTPPIEGVACNSLWAIPPRAQ